MSSDNSWNPRNIMKLVSDETRGHKRIPTTGYQLQGRTPVVDQSQILVAGYTEEPSTLTDPPYIVFGDHTREIKYLDQPFLPGAQGVRILKATQEADPKFLYHYLAFNKVQNLGYSRHFKLFKQIEIHLPPLAEQQRIAEILDSSATVIQQIESQLLLLADLATSYAAHHSEHEEIAPLSSFGSFSGGMTPDKKNPNYWGGLIRWFTTKDLKKPVLVDSIDHATDQAIDETSLKLIDTPSIAFSLRGMSLAHTVPMSRLPAYSTVNQDLKAFVPHDPDHVRVLYTLIKAKTPWLLSKVSTAGHGTKKLDFTHLQNLELPVLPEEEFAQLDKVLSQIEDLEQKKNQELESFRELQESLSTRAFARQL